MKKIIFLIALILSCYSYSQTQTRDVIYLKNGSVIKGKIIEMNPSGNLKIETADGSLFVYRMDEIKKWRKKNLLGKR